MPYTLSPIRRLDMKCIRLFLLAVISPMTFSQQPAKAAATKPAPKIVYIRAGRRFQGTSDTVQQNAVIMVQDDRIQSVVTEGRFAVPAGANVIDLSRATVLPGLIDCHTHLGSRADRY